MCSRAASRCRPESRCNTARVSVAEVIATILVSSPLVIVGVVFIWAARKDGEEDQALQRRLGIRRKTRLGR
jgi:hypothetical protein